MKISKKNLMSFARNHAYGEEVLGKGTTRSQTINSFVVEFMFGERVGEIRMLVTMKYGIITEAFILYK